MKLTEEILRIANTHGLSKDVIDLLEKKASLLEEELQQSREREKKKDIKIAYLESQLEELQPVGFTESEGLLWKKTNEGFERRPYCPSCKDHPVMMVFSPSGDMFWACPNNHTFDYNIKPPEV